MASSLLSYSFDMIRLYMNVFAASYRQHAHGSHVKGKGSRAYRLTWQHGPHRIVGRHRDLRGDQAAEDDGNSGDGHYSNLRAHTLGETSRSTV